VVQRVNLVFAAQYGFVDDDWPEQGALPNKFVCIYVIFESPGFSPGLQR